MEKYAAYAGCSLCIAEEVEVVIRCIFNSLSLSLCVSLYILIYILSFYLYSTFHNLFQSSCTENCALMSKATSEKAEGDKDRCLLDKRL